MVGQAGEAEHEGRGPAVVDPQGRDPLDGHAALGGGLDDGLLVEAGGKLEVQLDPGRHAVHGRAGQPSRQGVDHGIAAGPVAAPHLPQMTVVGAGGDEPGQRVLVEHR